jgi:heme iron utilization protein
MTEVDLADDSNDPAARARHLVRQSLTTSLATTNKDAAPFVSLVICACDYDGSPLLLMSTLAVHTRHIDRDSRASLLFDGTGSLDVPMTGPRVTLSGRLERTGDDHHRQRFLRRHPDAALYADFDDFSFFHLDVSVAHLVCGFGRVNKIRAGELLPPCSLEQDLMQREADIVAHMNDDHQDALDDIARHFCGSSRLGWLMTGIDADGIDLRQGGQAGRVDFSETLADIGKARDYLVNLAQSSRNQG